MSGIQSLKPKDPHLKSVPCGACILVAAGTAEAVKVLSGIAKPSNSESRSPANFSSVNCLRDHRLRGFVEPRAEEVRLNNLPVQLKRKMIRHKLVVQK